MEISNVNVTKQEEKARTYNISVESKTQLQNLKNFSSLGKKLVEKALEDTDSSAGKSATEAVTSRYYHVKQGDTLWNITIKIFNLPPDDVPLVKAKMKLLTDLNKIQDKDYILTGSLLKTSE